MLFFPTAIDIPLTTKTVSDFILSGDFSSSVAVSWVWESRHAPKARDQFPLHSETQNG